MKALKRAGADKASCIGRVTEDDPGIVSVETVVGGKRILVPLGDELLPRIC